MKKLTIVLNLCLLQKCQNASASRKVFNHFPNMTILQQTTLNIFCQKIENLHNWMDNLWLKVESIVAKGEIARFEQFLLLSLYMFSKRLSAAEVSESVYMRERVKSLLQYYSHAGSHTVSTLLPIIKLIFSYGVYKVKYMYEEVCGA